MIPARSGEAVPDCGSYEVRFPDGRPSKYFYPEAIRRLVELGLKAKK
jgi:hypothetical protein